MELGHAYSVLVVSASAKFNESVRGLLPERFYWPVTGLTDAALSAEMEQQCRNFDAELEQETNRKIQELKDNLEAQKDQELTSLRHRTEQQLEDLDTYYRQNHQQLTEDLFQQLLRY